MASKPETATMSKFVVLHADSADSLSRDLQQVLRAIRSHLGMDVAFVSEFTGGQRVFRAVDSQRDDQPVRVGAGDPLEQSYCQRVVDGRLPELIPDAAALPAAMELPVTAALPVGAHLSVPIRLKDGRVYGTFCCFSFTPDRSLNERDVGMMRIFADLTADRIERDLERGRERQDAEQRIHAALAGEAVLSVYQPIFDLEKGTLSGFESLTRFPATPTRSPDVWFNEAASVGLGVDLEMKAIEKALLGFKSLPSDIYISFNLSPESVLRGSFAQAIEGMPLERIVLEVTEHAAIDHYLDLDKALFPLREKGVRLAVDDAGAGYASFRHILSLRPNLIKLDISLTRDIDKDPARRALASALAHFGRETDSAIVAEGVETAAELRILRSLGIAKAQGYYLGRPVPLEAALEFCAPGRPLKSGFTM